MGASSDLYAGLEELQDLDVLSYGTFGGTGPKIAKVLYSW